jgi:hypothetical protein
MTMLYIYVAHIITTTRDNSLLIGVLGVNIMPRGFLNEG